MKLVVLLMLTLPGLSGALIRWSQDMLGYFSLDVQVVFVLAIFPVIMNVFQFCVMDQVIKAGKGAEHKEHSTDEYDEEEMDGYEAVPTREHDAPRQASGATLSRSSSRASSIASLIPEERGLLERDNVWSALSRQRGSTADEPPSTGGLARRSSRSSLRATDDDSFVDEPDAVPLSPLSPRISRT